jgi:hypothetical protein
MAQALALGLEMSKSPTGIVFLDLSDCQRGSVPKLVKSAMKEVPEGRMLVATWKVKPGLSDQVPIEALAARTVLGPPTGRNKDWRFFANGVTRAYVQGDESPHFYFYWVIFRKTGPAIYKTERSQEVLRVSRLDTLNKVFTRDIANNVWHLPAKSAQKRTRERLTALLSWRDEVAVLLTRESRRTARLTKFSTEGDLIGRAEKRLYEHESLPITQSLFR